MNDRIRFVLLIVSFFQIKKMRPKKAINLFKVYQLVGDTAKTGTQISWEPEAPALDILSSWVGVMH